MSLIAKKYMGLMTTSQEIIRYGGPVADQMISESFVQGGAVTMDTALLTGAGGTLAVRGLLNYPRSTNDTPTQDCVTLHNAASVATDGNTFGPGDPALMLGLLEEAPDQEGANAWLMRPMFRRKLTNIRADTSLGAQTGEFLYVISRGDVAAGLPDRLHGVPVLSSTIVPKNRTKGAGTTLTVVVCGNFRRMVIGMVGAIEVVMRDQVLFGADSLTYRGIARFDMGILRPSLSVPAIPSCRARKMILAEHCERMTTG